MSYCRFSDDKHQVYLYGDCNGMFCCCGCKLLSTVGNARENSVWLLDRSAAILHLRHHRLYGHKFPRRAERLLMVELRDEGENFKKEPKAECRVCTYPVVLSTKAQFKAQVKKNTAEFRRKIKLPHWFSRRPKESWKRYDTRVKHRMQMEQKKKGGFFAKCN
jgi:hypothetical protein